MPPYLVAPFSPVFLFQQLSSNYCLASEIAKKYQAQYLARYLSALGAKTILTENEYVDHDYLDDFSQFYAKCFEPYGRFCKRLHFFSNTIDEPQFQRILKGEIAELEEASFKDSYLGFTVARPLPDAVIGRTELKTYPPDGGRRHYTTTRKYHANLFGIDLGIESLAFQEQDKAMAACATVALWSCFHKAAELFQTTSPTPAEITRAANHLVNQARPVPSHGLELHQMCTAIRHVGLEPEVVQVTPSLPLCSLIYAHLRFGNPVLLGVDIEKHGLHAVALTGYSLLPSRHSPTEVPPKPGSIPMVGLRINEFYAHDDQSGPFSRLKVISSPHESNYIAFHADRYVDGKTNLQMWPQVVVIPIYNKIRLGFSSIHAITSKIAAIFEHVVSVSGLFSSDLEWDLHIVSSNAFKKKLRANPANMPGDELINALTKGHPRFAWRILLKHQGNRVIELLADTTAMEKSEPVYDLTWRDTQWKDGVRALFTNNSLRPRIEEILGPKIVKLFLKTF